MDTRLVTAGSFRTLRRVQRQRRCPTCTKEIRWRPPARLENGNVRRGYWAQANNLPHACSFRKEDGVWMQ